MTKKLGKVAALFALYPNMELHHTGGTCTAWRHPLDNGGHILITETEAFMAPDEETMEFCCVYYRDDMGNDDGTCTYLHDVSAVEAWIDGMLDAGAKPITGSVAEYFQQRMGRAVENSVFNGLQMATPLGDDCKCAIDSAHDFLKYVRGAVGGDDDTVEQVIAICETVICTYYFG